MRTASARRRARRERRREQKVSEAFAQYMDHAVDRVVARGLEEGPALDALFTLADYLTEAGKLPPFPTERASYAERGAWLVGAVDFGFIEFAEKAADQA